MDKLLEGEARELDRLLNPKPRKLAWQIGYTRMGKPAIREGAVTIAVFDREDICRSVIDQHNAALAEEGK
jgi:hypothetical protein